MGNFKTLAVAFCSNRTCCFPLDFQTIRVVYPYDSQRSKVLGAFLAEEGKNAVPYLQ